MMMSVDPRPAERSITRRALLERSLVLGSGALVLASCSGLGRQTAPGAAATRAVVGATAMPRRGGTLRISESGDIVRAGAPYRLTAANVHLFTLVYDTLVSYDTQLTPRPRLATSWEWSPDAWRLTLKLRPDVKFHTVGSSPAKTRSSTTSTSAIRLSVRNCFGIYVVLVLWFLFIGASTPT